MRLPVLALVAALALLPASGFAQSPPPAAPAAGAAAAKPQGISREDYIKRAADSAAARFDRMDSDHDGVLTREESRAYRESHHRTRRSAAPSPAPAAPKQQ
jgi:hypothetical protein